MSAFIVLRNRKPTHALRIEIKKKLKFTFMWVPNYHGIRGNEKAVCASKVARKTEGLWEHYQSSQLKTGEDLWQNNVEID